MAKHLMVDAQWYRYLQSLQGLPKAETKLATRETMAVVTPAPVADQKRDK